MKNIIAVLLLSVCLSSVAFAGDIPGSNPGGGCGTCRKVKASFPIVKVIETGFALIF